MATRTPPARRRLSPPVDDALPTILDFMRVLWALAHGLERASKRMRREVGVTGPQRLALRILGLRPGASAGELSAALHLHPSTLTGIIKRLQKQRLVARVADKTDRRRAVLSLTPRGQAINARSTGTVEAAVGAGVRAISADDLRTTRDVLSALAGRLERSAETAASRRPSASVTRRVTSQTSRSARR